MPISKQEREFLMFLRRNPKLSLNSSQLRNRFSNPHVPYGRILTKSRGLEQKISDFASKVEAIQLFLDKHDKFAPARSDAREFLAEKALDAIPVDELEDFISRYKAKIRRKTTSISGSAWIAPPEKTRALFKEITSRRRWVRSFAYFAGLVEKSDLKKDESGPGYLGGMKKFLMAKNLITRDGNLTPQGKRILGFFKDEINAKVKKKRRPSRPGRQPNPPPR